MANLVNQQIIEAGLIPTRTILDASNTLTNSGKEFIYYTNSSGGSKVITITAEVTNVDSIMFGVLTKANAVKTIANGETIMIGPFPVSAYNATDNLVTFSITPYNAEARDQASILFL